MSTRKHQFEQAGKYSGNCTHCGERKHHKDHASLLIEARDVLNMTLATLERVTVKHGPFSSTQGTQDCIRALLAKLDAE